MDRRDRRESGGLAPAALVVAATARLRTILAGALTPHCALVEITSDLDAGEALRRRFQFDLLVIEIRAREDPVLAWIDEVRALGADTALIAVTSGPTVPVVVAALRAGATDILATPFADHELQSVLRRARIRRTERPAVAQPAASAAETAAARIPVEWSMAEVERWHSLSVLAEVGGNKSRAARSLGVSRKTLERKLKIWSAAESENEEADGAPRRG